MRWHAWWACGYNNAFRDDKARRAAAGGRSQSVGLGGNVARSMGAMRPGEVPSAVFDGAGEDAGVGSLMRLAPVPCALFRRNHGTEWIAGWTLPMNWDEANYVGNGTKGVPHEGQLIIDYSSRARDGCGPNAATRAAVTKGFFLCAMPRPSEPHPPDA